MEFKANMAEDGTIEIKAIVEKKGNDVIIHIPSFKLINKITEDGKRNL